MDLAESSTNPKKRPRQPRRKICKAIGLEYVPLAAHILPRQQPCRHCNATKFAYETPNLCCSNGEIMFHLDPLPHAIFELMTSTSTVTTHFKQYARLYNNFFAFSSLGYDNIESKTEKGIYVFRLQGQLYHYLPSLTPNTSNRKYLQLYFYDGLREKEQRIQTFAELNPEIICLLTDLMSTNPYASFFRKLSEHTVDADTRITISKNPVLDQRVYNAPTCDDVAAIIVDNDDINRINSPDVIVMENEMRTDNVGGIKELKKKPRRRQEPEDTLFPLLFDPDQTAPSLILREEQASQRTHTSDNSEISCREYYSYRFQIRDNNNIIKAGRIYQQYIVDMYVKIENTILDFLRRNQKTIRSELYQGIVDSVHEGYKNAFDIGKRIILPASFIGGPRDMKRRYLNAMTLVQRYGKPDLFITMTCNPNWPEIKEHLSQGEKTQDRPDLLTRVFRSKLTALKKTLIENEVFGKVAARVDVVEFQKRGLPHAHLLIILTSDHKIHNADSFDKYVCAELPPKHSDGLRKLVIQHMMHGPCGKYNTNCACMRLKGKRKICKFGYPKNYSEYTTSTEDSYPVYKRPNNGDSVQIRGASLDNKWVIPYNPYLLAMFNCHINVEICSTIGAVKYIYKYVYKGHDKVNFALQSNKDEIRDEISDYQNGRWISPPESAWRIFSFDLYDIHPAVIPLQIHLPQMNPISFSKNETLVDIITDGSRQTTMLTGFFEANKNIASHTKYLYAQFPEFFVWSQKNKAWQKRYQRPSVGRLTYVNPCEGERYYLRLLLTHVKGPTSFENLKTVTGHLFPTFEEAALKHGLIELNGYTEACMQEAVAINMPKTLRRLFATLLVFCTPTDPQLLWESYYEALSEDYSHQYPADKYKSYKLTWHEIESYLDGMGKSLNHYRIKDIHFADKSGSHYNRDIEDALNAPIPKQYINAHKLLNVRQKIAYKYIMKHVKTNKGGAFFIDGTGGTGKTFLYCSLYAKLRTMNKIVLPTATSGIAASNLPTGRTAHSRFKIPIDDNSNQFCNVSKQSNLANLLRQTTLIIWDEASMAKKQNIESLNTLLQDICNSSELFGGKIVVFGGDFRQVLPVVPHKGQKEAINASLVSSTLWPRLVKFQLDENIRASEDPEFANILLNLGDGKLQTEEQAHIKLPQELIQFTDIKQSTTELLIANTFPEMLTSYLTDDIFTTRAILTPKNIDVDYINEEMISNFPGTAKTYTSFDSVTDDCRNIYPIEFLNTLNPNGMSPHLLVLKQNCPVILVRNLDPLNGLCNGTRLLYKNFHKNLIHCEITTGYYKGEQAFIPRIILKPSTTKYPFAFQRKQFPIKLCFAMTINKSQGQTLDQVTLYLREPCFAHGQIYVALSRAKRRQGIHVFAAKDDDVIAFHDSIKNTVSFEILQKAREYNFA